MKPVKRGVGPILVLVGILGLCIGTSFAQVTNQQVVNLLDFNHVGTRAQALGGAFVAVADDETAAYWNPGGVSGIVKDTVPFGLSVTVAGDNFPTPTQLGAIGDITQDAQAFLTIIASESASLQQRIDAVNQLLDLVNRVPGIAPDVKNNIFLGANALNVGVFANIFTGGRFVLTRNNNQDANGNAAAGVNTANLGGGLAGLGEVGVAFSKTVGDDFNWGVAIKGMGGVVGVGNAAMDTNGTSVSNLPDLGQITQSIQNPVLGVDLGMIKEMSPDSRFGAVIRNVNAPDPFGANAMGLRPQVDIGWAQHGKHGVFAIDVHNLTATNARPSTFHLGLERRVFDVAYVRAGLNAGDPSIGFGLRALTLHLDLSAGLDSPAGGFVTFALASRF